MASYTVDCPVCPSTATVTLGEDVAIYRIEGFEAKPGRLSLAGSSPAAALGEKLYLDRDDQRRPTARCGNDHYLRVFAAEYVHVPRENCLYEPADAPAVECPHCRFRYGTHEQFVHEADTDRPESTHVLRSVTTEREPGHTEIGAITREACVANARLAVSKACPHCGRRAYFNYRNLDIDPTVHFLGIESA